MVWVTAAIAACSERRRRIGVLRFGEFGARVRPGRRPKGRQLRSRRRIAPLLLKHDPVGQRLLAAPVGHLAVADIGAEPLRRGAQHLQPGDRPPGDREQRQRPRAQPRADSLSHRCPVAGQPVIGERRLVLRIARQRRPRPRLVPLHHSEPRFPGREHRRHRAERRPRPGDDHQRRIGPVGAPDRHPLPEPAHFQEQAFVDAVDHVSAPPVQAPDKSNPRRRWADGGHECCPSGRSAASVSSVRPAPHRALG